MITETLCLLRLIPTRLGMCVMFFCLLCLLYFSEKQKKKHHDNEEEGKKPSANGKRKSILRECNHKEREIFRALEMGKRRRSRRCFVRSKKEVELWDFDADFARLRLRTTATSFNVGWCALLVTSSETRWSNYALRTDRWRFANMKPIKSE